jgi:hypothetical protein
MCPGAEKGVHVVDDPGLVLQTTVTRISPNLGVFHAEQHGK